MAFRKVIDRFESKSPICVMAKVAMENVLSAERLDSIFENAADRQQNKRLMFSSVVDIMGLVACKIQPSVHAAYLEHQQELGVTVKALYDKLQRMEGNVSRQLVRETASQMAEIIEKTKGTLPEWACGYRTKIVDGNHLRRTQRRIKELRTINGAPLPGHCAVILDPRLKLAIDVIPCEDGHAQERTLLPQILETVEPKDLWIADRNFCTIDFLFGIKSRRGYFVIRQHGNMPFELIGRRKRIGATETGVVFEQKMRIVDSEGNAATIRRITVRLHEPTRDDQTEIHILTNLPKKITAIRVAEIYRKRWTIETAFQEVALNLEGEIETLGYPRAALFSFCMALVSYNVLSVILAAMRAAHGIEAIEDRVSFYYMCDEIAATNRGLEIAVSEEYWADAYATRTPTQIARELVRIAKKVKLSRYRKYKRGPKKPPPPMNKKRRNHVSTARILAQNRAGAGTT